MKWILIVGIALLALAVLAVLTLGLWRRVKALGSAVAQAGEVVAQASESLALAQGDGAGREGAPLGSLPRPPAVPARSTLGRGSSA